MNKVKKFEISIVDRTYSKVISDVVKFYSSDSALEVIFVLAEEGYEFDSAELVLSNTDGSLITRPLTKSPEGYSYEIEKNIISHHGEWKGQVILNSVDDSYVSSKIRFTIEDDLLSGRPPKLTDVYSWTSLKRYADSLTKELKQAVLEVEGMDDTFNENELERQVTFESNESERNQTFNTNEATRQVNETARVEAEKKRNETVKNIESRQRSVENQFISVQEELTEKDVISAPEIIAARNGEANLKTRLDVEHQEVTAQLAQIQQEREQWRSDKASLSFAINRKPLKVFSSDFEETSQGSGILREWNDNGTMEINVAPSTRQDGGNTITFADTGTGLGLIKTKQIHGYATTPQWFTTDEITMPTNQTFSFNIQALNNGRRGQISINSGGPNTVQINSDDGLGLQTVANVSASTGFDSTKPFRLAMWYNPVSGKVRFYIFFGGPNVRHVYLGERENTNKPLPIAFIQFNTGNYQSGNVTAARVEAYEVRGIIHGCSTDSPNNVFDMSPEYFPKQSRYYNSADALSLRLWGQREGIINMTHGGWTIEQMENGGLSVNGEDTANWANMVIQLKPRFVVIGSAINSISAAAALLPDSTAAYDKMELTKAGYLRLIDASLNAGIGFIAVRNCAPVGGHVSFPKSAHLDMVDDWNEWMATLPNLYPNKLTVSDAWGALVDPNNPRTLLPLYDIGDHIHFTVAGGEALAEADAKAVLGLQFNS